MAPPPTPPRKTPAPPRPEAQNRQRLLLCVGDARIGGRHYQQGETVNAWPDDVPAFLATGLFKEA
jgi:hypothetical protein